MKTNMLILAYLRAMVYLYQTAHWQVQGESYYGDHLLLQRLYETVSAEVDGHAEKCVQKFGSAAVDARVQNQLQTKLINSFAQPALTFELLLDVETRFLSVIDRAMELMQEEGILTHGWNDHLGALASAHEDNMYLLQQRIKR